METKLTQSFIFKINPKGFLRRVLYTSAIKNHEISVYFNKSLQEEIIAICISNQDQLHKDTETVQPNEHRERNEKQKLDKENSRTKKGNKPAEFEIEKPGRR
ncbi:uncharacterized protein G2W53_011775 [Senna tora]|uniref:Uncharacterized protein n=1 Tax=Senna tora TaxID=362788 RepID=A0A834TWP0_9FABA|nr:uncharacterized protein G2W53_011775 [Senna tora]